MVVAEMVRYRLCIFLSVETIVLSDGLYVGYEGKSTIKNDSGCFSV